MICKLANNKHIIPVTTMFGVYAIRFARHNPDNKACTKRDNIINKTKIELILRNENSL